MERDETGLWVVWESDGWSVSAMPCALLCDRAGCVSVTGVWGGGVGVANWWGKVGVVGVV